MLGHYNMLPDGLAYLWASTFTDPWFIEAPTIYVHTRDRADMADRIAKT